MEFFVFFWVLNNIRGVFESYREIHLEPGLPWIRKIARPPPKFFFPIFLLFFRFLVPRRTKNWGAIFSEYWICQKRYWLNFHLKSDDPGFLMVLTIFGADFEALLRV